MSNPNASTLNTDVDGSGPSDLTSPPTYGPPAYASFSPPNLTTAASAASRRSTILVHQKSPLLLATPPQITRALAYSHPFLLPLNRLAGLVTWTTGDPWESFLLVAAFWAVVQYGNVAVRYAGPLLIVFGLIAGMYGRRFSPLSSSGWNESSSTSSPPASTGTKGKNAGASAAEGASSGGGAGSGGSGGSHSRSGSVETTGTRHQKTLDEIVDTLKIFTTRCNILLEPLLEMTDFLSTQRTATSATTRPALTTLFVRLLAVTPIWVALTLPPLRIISTKRVVLVAGTLILTWHSRPCRVARTLLWRSATVRRISRWVTGLQFAEPVKKPTNGGIHGTRKQPADTTVGSNSALAAAIKRSRTAGKTDLGGGVRFTFILYENQRRWVGLGWTSSLFAYERGAWTDDQNNPLPSKDNFELPEVDDAPARWRWVPGSHWKVDGVPAKDGADYDGDAGRNGWIFYDNKVSSRRVVRSRMSWGGEYHSFTVTNWHIQWQNGRRGQDGWGRWTRRRKWYRDAELVEKGEVDAEASDENNGKTQSEKGAATLNPPSGIGKLAAAAASAPALPPRSVPQPPSNAANASASHTRELSNASTAPSIDALSSSLPSDTEKDKLSQIQTDHEETAQPINTSPKSTTSRFRFPTPTLRRRNTGGSTILQQEKKKKQQQEQEEKQKRERERKNSESATNPTPSHTALTEEEEASFGSLTPALELEIQGMQRNQGSWGVGDEAVMGFE